MNFESHLVDNILKLSICIFRIFDKTRPKRLELAHERYRKDRVGHFDQKRLQQDRRHMRVAENVNSALYILDRFFDLFFGARNAENPFSFRPAQLQDGGAAFGYDLWDFSFDVLFGKFCKWEFFKF